MSEEEIVKRMARAVFAETEAFIAQGVLDSDKFAHAVFVAIRAMREAEQEHAEPERQS